MTCQRPGRTANAREELEPVPANSDPKPSMACTSELTTYIPGPQFPLMRINLHPKDFVMLLIHSDKSSRRQASFTPGVERQGLKGRNKAPDELRSEPRGPSNTPVRRKSLGKRRGVLPLKRIWEDHHPCPTPSLLSPEKTTRLHWPRQKWSSSLHTSSPSMSGPTTPQQHQSIHWCIYMLSRDDKHKL